MEAPRGEVADTPPDPTGHAWDEVHKDACAPLTINGVTFDTDPWNMMNYNPDCAGQHRTISPDQIGVMLNALRAPDRVNLFDPNIALQTRGVAIGTTQDGRMQMFATGLEGRVATRWKTGDANSTWTDWSSFGTLTSPGKIASLRHSNGYNEVFAVSNGQIWNRYQVNDQGSWSSWAAFETEGGHRDVDTAIYSDTRRMLWTVREGRVYTQLKLSTDAFSSWAEPSAFFDANVTNLAVGTVPNGAGRLQVFEVIGGRLYTRWQITTGWNWSSQSDFGLAASDVSVGVTPDGRMQVYAIDSSSGRVMTRAKTTTDANSAWESWTSGPGGMSFTHLAAGNLQDGRLQLFGVRYGAVWQSYTSGASFTAWSNF